MTNFIEVFGEKENPLNPSQQYYNWSIPFHIMNPIIILNKMINNKYHKISRVFFIFSPLKIDLYL